jgi:hypothetical protein
MDSTSDHHFRLRRIEMRQKLALIAALALVGVPAGALAAKPPHPSTPASTNANGKAKTETTTTTTASTHAKTPKVLYVLRGKLSRYTPANGTTNGSISITVNGSNFDSKTLKTQTLVFPVSSSTKVVLHAGKAIADNDKGIVKVKAAKHTASADLQKLTATQIVDQGASA